MVLSRHFAGPAFRYRARIGRKIRNTSAFPQVTGMALKPLKIVKVFELCLLPVPPAGFEPALTAPEAVALSPELRGLKDRSKVTSPGGAASPRTAPSPHAQTKITSAKSSRAPAGRR